MNAREVIKKLGMRPIPEGGMCAEYLGSQQKVDTPAGQRRLYSTIYYLLEKEQRSAFHKLKSDEIWAYHAGAPFTIYIIKDRKVEQKKLGPNLLLGQEPQMLIPAGTVFGAKTDGDFGLCTCFTSPGFNDRDLSLISAEQLESLIDNPHDYEWLTVLSDDSIEWLSR